MFIRHHFHSEKYKNDARKVMLLHPPVGEIALQIATDEKHRVGFILFSKSGLW
jgi:hypothetical protein